MTATPAPGVPAAAAIRPRRRLVRWLPAAGLLLVVAVALVIGSQRHTHPTLEQRTMSIASVVKCPMCVGETAAQSQIPSSVAIRTVIRQELQAGEGRSEILSGLSASYGPSILEQPPAHGIDLLLWVLPVVAVLVAIAGLTLAFVRWRPARIALVSDDDRRLVGELLDLDASPTGGRVPSGGGGPPSCRADR